jgi:hypothetical protein
MKKIAISAITAVLGASGTAQAALVLDSTQSFQGTGLGAVNTLLTLQSPGSSSFEQGSVAVGAGNAQVLSGDAKKGASQTQLRTLGDLGVGAASDLRIVFNAAEPGNAAANGITLSNLVLTIYGTDGSALFTSGAFSPVSFTDTMTGIGRSDAVFRLDATQAAQAQSAVFAAGGFSAYRVGLAATLEDATGGPETFFVTRASTGNPPPVPEPSTYAMLLAGMAGIGGVVMRRRRR